MRNTDPRKAAEVFIDKVVAPRRAPRSSDAKARAARSRLAHEDMELVKRDLVASGLDPERLDRLAAVRSKGHKKLAEEARRNAVEASAAAAGRLKGLVSILPASPMDVTVNQVTFIRSFAGQGSVLESNIEPSNNWARYRMEGHDDVWAGTGRLSFFTLWRNQLTVPASVMARANLAINAHLSCDADWSGVASWFGLGSTARAAVSLRTTVWGMDSSVSSIVNQQDVDETSVDGGFFGDDSSKSIEFSQLLPASAVVVPADTYVLIEVEVLTDWSLNSGASVTFDAESGSHRVDLPQLVLTVLPTEELPPISLSASVDTGTSPPTVTLSWTGATTNMVDIYHNGTRLATAPNNGTFMRRFSAGTHVFRVCEAGSGTVCSANVTVNI
jgi:hypothetical protein